MYDVLDNRNIVDKYRGMSTEDIQADLQTTAAPFIPIFVNVDGDFNKASGVRNSNWFNCAGVIMTGRKKWDRRGAVGTNHYTPVYHYESYEKIFKALKIGGYTIVAAEITDNAKPLTSYKWPERVAVVFGEENAGLSNDVLSLCDDIVYIPGRGSVRSLNVSTTSGIFMYDYMLKRGMI